MFASCCILVIIVVAGLLQVGTMWEEDIQNQQQEQLQRLLFGDDHADVLTNDARPERRIPTAETAAAKAAAAKAKQ